MTRPTVAAIALAFVSLVASADDEGAVWRGTVKAPGHLPDVDIVAGYPGPYVPVTSSPIELHARATKPFDGYIGYRFVVGRNGTIDIPVLSRATMAAGSQWSLRTTMQLKRPAAQDLTNRELLIQWFDRSFNVLAARKAGTVPWSQPRPLRIVGPQESTQPRHYFGGDESLSLPPQALGSDAQWWAGFSSVVVPVEVWLDLPPETREAIFHSGAGIAFFGTPRTQQRTTKLDDAILPVRFGPGTWAAVPDAETIGARSMPSVVATPGRSYVPNEEALREPLPAIFASTPVGDGWTRDMLKHPNLDLLRRGQPLIPLLAAAVIAPICWMRLRRKTDLRWIAVALLAAVGVLAVRPWSRPGAELHLTERWTYHLPGVVSHRWNESLYGRPPLPASRVSRSDARSSVVSLAEVSEDAEIRTSETLPGHGAVLYAKLPWDSTSRTRWRVEFANAPNIRVSQVGPRAITFDYQVPISPRVAVAYWSWRGVRRSGEIDLREASGRATIDAGTFSPRSFRWLGGYWNSTMTRHGSDEVAELALVDDGDRGHTRIIQWSGPSAPSAFMPYELTASARPDSNHRLSWSFRLPTSTSPARPVLQLRSPFTPGLTGVELTGDHGTIPFGPPTHGHPGNLQYTAPLADVAQVARPGEIVRVHALAKNASAQEPVELTLIMQEWK